MEGGNWQAWNALGALLEIKGDKDGALKSFEKALRHKRDFLPGLINYGRLLEQKGNRKAAQKAFKRALELNPRDDVANAAIKRLSGKAA